MAYMFDLTVRSGTFIACYIHCSIRTGHNTAGWRLDCSLQPLLRAILGKLAASLAQENTEGLTVEAF